MCSLNSKLEHSNNGGGSYSSGYRGGHRRAKEEEMKDGPRKTKRKLLMKHPRFGGRCHRR